MTSGFGLRCYAHGRYLLLFVVQCSGLAWDPSAGAMHMIELKNETLQRGDSISMVLHFDSVSFDIYFPKDRKRPRP